MPVLQRLGSRFQIKIKVQRRLRRRSTLLLHRLKTGQLPFQDADFSLQLLQQQGLAMTTTKRDEPKKGSERYQQHNTTGNEHKQCFHAYILLLIKSDGP